MARFPSFQSTLPLRGATIILSHQIIKITISIHTPLAGSDAGLVYKAVAVIDFNPHSPCGERPDEPEEARTMV